ncbi:cytochrome P450 [Xylariomycetidae sp. FL0641]|nr:cytochrome P450 [Xylariomycetidae sp. FL0641]
MTPASTYLAGFGLREATLLVAVLLLFLVALNHAFAIRYPKNLPRFGRPKGKTSVSWRARWKYHTDNPPLFQDVYEKYSKRGRTVLVPNLAFKDEVVLPSNAIRWLITQPESKVSAHWAQRELIQPYYSLGHDKFGLDPWGGNLVKTELNSAMDNVCAAMNDELDVAIETHFGTDTEQWKDIDLYPAARMIVAQASSRFTLGDSPVGLSLCRNPEYLKLCLEIADLLVLNAGVAGSSPNLLRPILGRLGSWPVRRKIRQLRGYFEPLYRERMAMLLPDATTEKAQQHEHDHEPRDHMHMMLRYALRERRAEALSLDDMTRRLCVANFGSMHQTSIQAANLLLDILASDGAFGTVAALRDEAARVRGRGEEGSRAALAAMIRADSAARESLRLHAFGTRALSRKVVAPAGVVTEDGVRLPRGAMVSVLARGVHTDAEVYGADARAYDPFRFSRQREGDDGGGGGGGGGKPSLSFVSTSAHYLPFSHGRHACPGRFIVDAELKMLLAAVLGRYDVALPAEYGGSRPPNVNVAEAYFPPEDARVRVRRRRAC